MNAYIDSSVVLRVVLGAVKPLREWQSVDQLVASSLLSVECFRTMHRLRKEEPLSDEEFVGRIQTAEQALARIQLVAITTPVIERASGAFAMPLKTLDAIHLATAMLWREREDASIVFATHDRQLSFAARASGFSVIGL